MAYTKFNNPWRDGEAGGTPVTAEALNHIEDGIRSLDVDALPRAEASATYMPRTEGAYAVDVLARDAEQNLRLWQLERRGRSALHFSHALDTAATL